MKKTSTIIFTALCSFILCLNALAYSELELDPEMLALREDVITLNLVNNLCFNKYQMNEYLKALYKLKHLERNSQEEAKYLTSQQKRYFTNYKNSVSNNTPDINVSMHKAKKLDDNFKELVIKHNKERSKLELRIKSLLTDNQLSVVSDFIPCFVPPDELKDPSRIGMAETSSDILNGLQEIRKMHWLVYAVAREIFINKYMEFYENQMRSLSNKDKEIEKARLFKIMDEARAMNEVDFNLNKDQLSRRVVAKIKNEMDGYKKHDVHFLGKVLLNSRIIPVIEKKLAQLN